MKNFLKRSIYSFLVLCGLFFSCNDVFFSQRDIVLLDDRIRPQILLEKPKDNGYYSSSVIVEGRVADFADQAGNAGGIRELSYEIAGTYNGGQVLFDEEGRFSFHFSTEGFVGHKTLLLRAADENGNHEEVSVTLRQGTLPGFVATPANHSVELRWDPVDMATGYTLFYSDDGYDPSETDPYGKIENVTSPVVLNNLSNGKLYSFLLIAHTAGYGENRSEILKAIPLSPFSLAPKVRGGYKQIELSWPPIPAAERFSVLRATSRSGPFTRISNQLADNYFLDTQVSDGIHYFYRIAPSLAGSPESAVNSGQTLPVTPLASLLGSVESSASALDVAVYNGYVYLAHGLQGIGVVDASGSLAYVNSIEVEGNVIALSVSETYLFAACDSAGLYIFSLADPANPTEVAVYDTPGNVMGVAVSGGYAMVADGDKGLEILDLSPLPDNPPVRSGGLGFSGTFFGVTVSGNYAYVAAGTDGLRIIDVSSPGTPLEVNYLTGLPGLAVDVVTGSSSGKSYAYLACGSGGVVVIDVSSPANPLSGYTGRYDSSGNAVKIALRGEHLFLSDEAAGLAVLNISDPSNLVKVAEYRGAGSVKGVAVSGTTAYAACGVDGVRLLYAGSPADSQSLTSLFTAGDAGEAAVYDDYLYVTDSAGYIRVADIALPAAAALTGSLELPGTAPEDISICGEYAFVAGNNLGIAILSLEEPLNPVIAGSYPLTNCYSTSVELSGDYLYLSYWSIGGTGVKIIDVSDPSLPVLSGGYQTAGYAWDVAVVENYAFTADQGRGLHIADVSQKDSAGRVQSYEVNMSSYRLELFKEWAVIADGAKGLKCINVRNPLSPSYSGGCLIRKGLGTASDLAVAGEYAFIAAQYHGLQIARLSDPSEPVILAAVPSSALVSRIAVYGPLGFLSKEGGELEIIRFGN